MSRLPDLDDYDDPDDWDRYEDAWDDEVYVQEPPYCYACHDGGCPECEPSRLRWAWWTVRSYLAHLRTRLRPGSRKDRPPVYDEPPF